MWIYFENMFKNWIFRCCHYRRRFISFSSYIAFNITSTTNQASNKSNPPPQPSAHRTLLLSLVVHFVFIWRLHRRRRRDEMQLPHTLALLNELERTPRSVTIINLFTTSSTNILFSSPMWAQCGYKRVITRGNFAKYICKRAQRTGAKREGSRVRGGASVSRRLILHQSSNNY